MKLGNKTFVPFIPEADILKRIKELAAQISEDFAEKDPLFIVILNGAFLFAADLMKEVKIPCQISFIKVSSYSGTESRGKVDTLFGINQEIKGRHVILVDDIVDTGITMAKVLSDVKEKEVASATVASLLIKPDAFHNQFKVHYAGFSIPNDFVVGYGLDYEEYGRNLKDIYKLK